MIGNPILLRLALFATWIAASPGIVLAGGPPSSFPCGDLPSAACAGGACPDTGAQWIAVVDRDPAYAAAWGRELERRRLPAAAVAFPLAGERPDDLDLLEQLCAVVDRVERGTAPPPLAVAVRFARAATGADFMACPETGEPTPSCRVRAVLDLLTGTYGSLVVASAGPGGAAFPALLDSVLATGDWDLLGADGASRSELVLFKGAGGHPPADPCLPCRGFGANGVPEGVWTAEDLAVDVQEVRPLIPSVVYTAILLEVGGELEEFTFSYDPETLYQLAKGELEDIVIPDFFRQHNVTQPAILVFSSTFAEPVGCGENCIAIERKRIDFLGCREKDGSPFSCPLIPGCAYYRASGQCHPIGTSECDAGELDACLCRRLDANPFECAETIGCEYFEPAKECHPEGTLLCNTGYNGPECSTCHRYDGDFWSCEAIPECSYVEGECYFSSK